MHAISVRVVSQYQFQKVEIQQQQLRRFSEGHYQRSAAAHNTQRANQASQTGIAHANRVTVPSNPVVAALAAPSAASSAPAQLVASSTNGNAATSTTANGANVSAQQSSQSSSSKSASDSATVKEKSSEQTLQLSGSAPKPAAETPVKVPDEVVQATPSQLAKFRASERLSTNETSFSFQVTTQDGDKVTVNVSLLDAQYRLNVGGRDTDGNRVRQSASESQSQRLVSVSVEGELDEGELDAIDKLSAGVLAIASDFLSGDGRAAAQKASALEFDSSELSNFALSLSQKKSVSVTRVKLQGETALDALSRLDEKFASSVQSLGERMRGLINEPNQSLDRPEVARFVQRLLPELFAPLGQSAQTQLAPQPTPHIAPATAQPAKLEAATA